MGGGWWLWQRLSGPTAPTAMVTQQTIGPYRFKVLGYDSPLHKAKNPIRIEITDAATGKRMDVGSENIHH
jgi:hypothetical protein